MISGFVPPFGGVETVVNELSKFLSKKGAEITIFGRSEKNSVQKTAFGKIVGLRPFDYLPKQLHFVHYHKYAYSFEVWRRLQHELPFDLVHGHGDNCFFPSLLRSGTPFIMTFHGTLKGAFSLLSRLGPRAIPAFYTEKVAAIKCDMAIACSAAVKKELIDFYGVNPNKIVVIHNGVNTEKFFPLDKNYARKKLGLPLEKRYGIWVGTNPSLKGLSTAIESVLKLQNIKLIVLGVKGDNDEKVIYFGHVSDLVEKVLLYNAADFLIFPTMYEGFPVVPLEAMGCGVPIIVSKEANMEEIIKDGVHGFIVKDRNPKSYREKIESMLNDDKKLHDMSIQCRKLAMNYNWKKQAKKYWEIYQKMVNKC
jgi:glycosyltransferase involved in cell wall biosynthesis